MVLPSPVREMGGEARPVEGDGAVFFDGGAAQVLAQVLECLTEACDDPFATQSVDGGRDLLIPAMEVTQDADLSVRGLELDQVSRVIPLVAADVHHEETDVAGVVQHDVPEQSLPRAAQRLLEKCYFIEHGGCGGGGGG